VRFAFINERREEYPVAMMCDMLEVSRSGYYAWRDRPPCAREGWRQERIEEIRQVFEQSRRSYGSGRITVELKEMGVELCENTVAKYMRQIGLLVQPRRRYVPQTTDSAHEHPIASNTLDRDFAAEAPNLKWCCDLTYVPTDEGWLYLSVVIDLFSRKVVGWSMTDHLRAEGVVEALSMAIAARKPRAHLLHHSDRGVQYACTLYRDLLDRHQIVASMSRPGNCYDNAVAESFFATFKTELVQRRHYATHAQAKTDIFEWIECWYNRRRRHSSLGYLSPEAFEAQIN
jgi:transposase InsO family protein